MNANVAARSGVAVIHLEGRFDFGVHRQFKDCCEAAFGEAGTREIAVDFERVEYLDSSALGMLLLLKKEAASRDLGVALLNCRGLVGEILDVANFGVMFEIR